MASATFRIWRGNEKGGKFQDYRTEVSEGMVVLDAVLKVQAVTSAPEVAKVCQHEGPNLIEKRIIEQQRLGENGGVRCCLSQFHGLADS